MIEGTRVNLRAIEMTDLERCQRWINDREVTRHLAMRYPISMAAEETWLRELTSKPMSFDAVIFAIETKEGRHIGNLDLRDVQSENRASMLGIMIGERDCWSQGYGSDAVRTLLAFAFDEMNLNRVELHVFDDNERAIACYVKCGFVEEGRLRQDVYYDGAYHDAVVMSVLRDEFDAARNAESDAVASKAR